MRTEQIEEILSKNGIEQSKELATALESILKEYSKQPDRELIDSVDKGIARKAMLANRARGRR